jgi:hypothetical protein
MDYGLNQKSNNIVDTVASNYRIRMANSRFKEFFQLGEVGNYIIRVFKKPDPNNKPNFNLRMMHGINKISIIMFLMAIIFWVIKRVV